MATVVEVDYQLLRVRNVTELLGELRRIREVDLSCDPHARAARLSGVDALQLEGRHRRRIIRPRDWQSRLRGHL